MTVRQIPIAVRMLLCVKPYPIQKAWERVRFAPLSTNMEIPL